MMRDTLVLLVIAAGALLTGLLYAVGGYPTAQIVVAVPFLLAGPGLALVRLVRIGDPLTEGTLAVAVSLGLEAVVATALLAWGRWSPGLALAVVLAVTLAAIVGSLVAQRGRTRGAGSRRDGVAGPFATGQIVGKGGEQ